jgi:hypothetical protein
MIVGMSLESFIVVSSRKRMFFLSEKAVRELGYRWRAPAKAFEDAVFWLREQELL